MASIMAMVRATELHFENTHFVFYAHTPYGNAPVKANLIGRFNVYNVLAVLATLLASKVSLDDAIEAISHIQSAPGRMQSSVAVICLWWWWIMRIRLMRLEKVLKYIKSASGRKAYLRIWLRRQS